MIKIFVDDERQLPKGCENNYNVAKNYDKAIWFLNILKGADTINLDYDLGEAKTGLDILKYIHENNYTVKTIIIHSTHITGVRKMEKFIEENFTDVSYRYCPMD